MGYSGQKLKVLVVPGILLEGGRERINILMLIKVLSQSMETDNTIPGIVLQVQRFLTLRTGRSGPHASSAPSMNEMTYEWALNLSRLQFSPLQSEDTELEVLIYFFV